MQASGTAGALAVLHEWSEEGLSYRIVETPIGPQAAILLSDGAWCGSWEGLPGMEAGERALARVMAREMGRLAARLAIVQANLDGTVRGILSRHAIEDRYARSGG
jgi:hypothetical protein